MGKKEVNQEEVQGTAKKKGGAGKTILIVVVVLIVIGAIGSLSKKDSESSGSSSSESAAESSAESAKASSKESSKSSVDVNDAEAVKAAFKAGDFSMVSEDVKKLVDELEKASDDNMNAVKGKKTSEFVSDPVYKETLEIVTKNTYELDKALAKTDNPADKLYKEFVYERINAKREANGFATFN